MIQSVNSSKNSTSQKYIDSSIIDKNESMIQSVNKSKFISLFWLINPEYKNKKIEDDHQIQIAADIVTISFNCGYGNLRVDLFEINNDEAIEKNILFLNECKRLISVPIYPSSCYKLFYNVKNGNSIKMMILEQLISKTGEQWQNERPIGIFEYNNNESSLILSIIEKTSGKQFYYKFIDWQFDCFLDAAKFTFNEGFSLLNN